jgi:hypothetical protein
VALGVTLDDLGALAELPDDARRPAHAHRRGRGVQVAVAVRQRLAAALPGVGEVVPQRVIAAVLRGPAEERGQLPGVPAAPDRVGTPNRSGSDAVV